MSVLWNIKALRDLISAYAQMQERDAEIAEMLLKLAVGAAPFPGNCAILKAGLGFFDLECVTDENCSAVFHACCAHGYLQHAMLIHPRAVLTVEGVKSLVKEVSSNGFRNVLDFLFLQPLTFDSTFRQELLRMVGETAAHVGNAVLLNSFACQIDDIWHPARLVWLTYLQAATFSGQFEVVEFVIQRQRQSPFRPREANSGLMYALAQSGDSDILMKLHVNGIVRLNAKCAYTENLFCEAARRGHMRLLMMCFLICPGAWIHRLGYDAFLAAIEGHALQTALFLARREAIWKHDDGKALLRATQTPHPDLLRGLLQLCPRPAAHDNLAFRSACLQGIPWLVQMFLDSGRIDWTFNNFVSLRLACCNDHVAVLALLTQQAEFQQLATRRNIINDLAQLCACQYDSPKSRAFLESSMNG